MHFATPSEGTRRIITMLTAIAIALALVAPAAATTLPVRHLVSWGAPSLNVPEGIALTDDGLVWVADTGNHRLGLFDGATGDHIMWFGGPGSGTFQFNEPSGLALAPNGRIYVADAGNNRVQVYNSADMSFVHSLVGLNSPKDVAVARDGTVYVANTGSNRVNAFTPNGDQDGQWGGPLAGGSPGQFNAPGGIAVGPDGIVYVADTDNGRVQSIAFDGEGGVTFTHIDPAALFFPTGIDVATDGTILVVDAFDRVVYIAPDGTLIGEWGEAGFEEGKLSGPWDVAADAFGAVYVLDNAGARVQRFAVPTVARAAGANRFGTAADISRKHHPFFDVGEVFVATGGNFPDALAGAVAASLSGSPLLLTSSVPAETAAELSRLGPDEIIILGGPGAVDSATETALSAFAPTKRLEGINRYHTAIEISKHAFPDPGDAMAVVVATGQNFPDALAAASLAEQVGGPVLLTPTMVLPIVVADEIERLNPSNIYVVGGEAAVSADVLSALSSIAPTTRIAGANRYATAVEISEEAFPSGVDVVYLAVGTNFPDALTGAAQAARMGGPVLLTPSTGLPQNVAAEIQRLDPYAVVILGGTAVVSTAIEDQVKALLGI